MKEYEPVVSLLNLRTADMKLRATKAEWQSACYARTIAEVEQRCAELRSQACRYWASGAFLEGFGELTDRERKIALLAIDFVETGRASLG